MLWNRVPKPGRLSEERLRRLVEADVMGVVISRNDGTIVEANDALLRMSIREKELDSGAMD